MSRSIIPPAAENSSIAVMCPGGPCTRSTARGWRRRSTRSSPGQPARSNAASIATRRPGLLRVRAGVVVVRGLVRDVEGSVLGTSRDRRPHRALETGVLVVGGGAAGLRVALESAEAGARTVCVSRKPLSESSSFWAQGSGAGARWRETTPPSAMPRTRWPPGAGSAQERGGGAHERGSGGGRAASRRAGCASTPTRAASSRSGSRAVIRRAGSCTRGAARPGARSPRAWRSSWRPTPDADPREHSAGDGAVERRRRVRRRDHRHGRDRGAWTGGGAALWQRTTNPWGAIGAGSVLAHVELADLELCQFHPRRPGSDYDGALITEAVRGEGARLSTHGPALHRRARAPGPGHRGDPPSRIEADRCRPRPARPARIRPGAASERVRRLSPRRPRADASRSRSPPPRTCLIGGVACDLEGRAALPRLFAVGECACTGLHGANRLASNSLSECFVFGTRAAPAAVGEPQAGEGPDPPLWRFSLPPRRPGRRSGAGPGRSASGVSSSGCSPIPLRAS